MCLSVSMGVAVLVCFLITKAMNQLSNILKFTKCSSCIQRFLIRDYVQCNCRRASEKLAMFGLTLYPRCSLTIITCTVL